MKIIIASLLALASFNGQSQNFIEDNFPTKDGLILYTGVVEVDSSLSATDLYMNAKNWLVDAFKSSKAVIQVDDKELMIIVARSYISKNVELLASYGVDAKMWFTLKIEMKDHRYRYSLYGVRYECHVTTTDAVVGTSTTSVDQDYEAFINSLEVPKNEKKRIDFYNQTNEGCKAVDSDFKNLLISLEKGMKVKTTTDW